MPDRHPSLAEAQARYIDLRDDRESTDAELAEAEKVVDLAVVILIRRHALSNEWEGA